MDSSALILIFAVAQCLIGLAKGGHERMCFSVPVEKGDRSHSIGSRYIRDYYTKSGKPDFWKGMEQEPGDKPEVAVHISNVKLDDILLRNWYQIRVDTLYTQQIEKFVIDAVGHFNGDMDKKSRGDVFAGVGEFVPNFPSTCTGDHEYNITDEDFHIMPCGGTNPFESTGSSGLVYVPPPNLPEARKREAFMYWKINMSPCNFYDFVTFRVRLLYMDEVDNGTGHFVKTEVIAGFQSWGLRYTSPLGAADPFPRPGTYNRLRCDLDFEKGIIQDKSETYADWSCATPIHPEGTKLSDPLYTGRCAVPPNWSEKGSQKFRTDGKPSNLHVCHHNNNPSFKASIDAFPSYQNTINELINEMRKSCICDGSDTSSTSVSFSLLGGVLELFYKDSILLLRIWDVRVFHGIMMTILTIVVLPVNFFITRYYKETYMRVRVLDHHVWYFVHHFGIGLTLILIIGGCFQKSFLGVNLKYASKYHRNSGYLVIISFILMTLLGGFRAMRRTIRDALISMHFIIGMAIYLFCLANIFTSVRIPGSPSANVELDASFVDEGLGLGNTVAVMTLVWILFDIAIHVFMEIWMCGSTKHLHLTRPRYYFPSPIPVLDEQSDTDLPGYHHRRDMLFVYVTVSIIMGTGICAVIAIHRTEGRGLGQMSYLSDGTDRDRDRE